MSSPVLAFRLISHHRYARQLNRLKVIYERARESLQHTIRPNAATALLIRSVRAEFASLLPNSTSGLSSSDVGRYIAVHIRRGDRYGLSWKYHGKYIPIKDYAEVTSSTWSRLFLDPDLPPSSHPPSPVVYLASGNSMARGIIRGVRREEVGVRKLAGRQASQSAPRTCRPHARREHRNGMYMCGMCMRVCVRACVRACMCTCMCIRVYAYVRSGISTSTACVGQQKIDDTLGRGTKDALRRAKRASGRAGAGARQDKTGRVTGRVATQGATMQDRRAEGGEDGSRER